MSYWFGVMELPFLFIAVLFAFLTAHALKGGFGKGMTFMAWGFWYGGRSIAYADRTLYGVNIFKHLVNERPSGSLRCGNLGVAGVVSTPFIRPAKGHSPVRTHAKELPERNGKAFGSDPRTEDQSALYQSLFEYLISCISAPANAQQLIQLGYKAANERLGGGISCLSAIRKIFNLLRAGGEAVAKTIAAGYPAAFSRAPQ